MLQRTLFERPDNCSSQIVLQTLFPPQGRSTTRCLQCERAKATTQILQSRPLVMVPRSVMVASAHSSCALLETI